MFFWKLMGSGRMESGKLLCSMVSFCAARGGRSSNPVNLVNPVENARPGFAQSAGFPARRKFSGGRIFGQDLQDGQDFFGKVG